MPYQVKIKCGNPSCNTRLEVPQAGAVPKNWVVIRHEAPMKLDRNLNQIPQEPVTEVLCSWLCVKQYAEEQTKDKVSPILEKKR